MTTANQKYERETFRIPTWTLCYIYNRDTDNITEQEIAEVDRFQTANNIVTFGKCGEEYFAHTNDICQLGGTVVDVECLTLAQ